MYLHTNKYRLQICSTVFLVFILATWGCSTKATYPYQFEEYSVRIPISWDQTLIGTKAHELTARQNGFDSQWYFRTPPGSERWLYFAISKYSLKSGEEGVSIIKKALGDQLYFQQDIKKESDIKVIITKDVLYQQKYVASEVTYSFYNVDLLHDDHGKPTPRDDTKREMGRAILLVADRTLWVLDATCNSQDFQSATSDDFKYIFDSFRFRT